MTRYKPRELTDELVKAAQNMPVVVLSGMRQTGKSTLLKHLPIFKNYKYLNFDDLNTLESARLDPEGTIAAGQKLIIDEAQKFPEILSVIKTAVDRKRKPGTFILSGSANFLLLKNIAESLAGRAVYLTLSPFSRRERLGIKAQKPAIVQFLEKGIVPQRKFRYFNVKEITRGGMPSVCLSQVKDAEIWFRGYEQTYLERDIRSLSQVADLFQFKNLLQLLSLRNAQILKTSELARDAKLNVMTTTRYISLMETSFLLFRFKPYLRSKATRLVKSPKVYFSDTGLACHLAGIKKIDSNEPLRGALLENYVAANLVSVLLSYLPDARLAFWNIQGRYETDFIIEMGRETLAIEVKYGSRIQNKDLLGVKAFLESTPKCLGAILAYNGKETLRLGKKIWAVPIGLLLS